jgi:hypothetical protein
MASGKHRRRQSALTPRVTIGQVKYHAQYAITSVLVCSHCGRFRLRRYSLPPINWRLYQGVYTHRVIKPGEGVTAKRGTLFLCSSVFPLTLEGSLELESTSLSLRALQHIDRAVDLPLGNGAS